MLCSQTPPPWWQWCRYPFARAYVVDGCFAHPMDGCCDGEGAEVLRDRFGCDLVVACDHDDLAEGRSPAMWRNAATPELGAGRKLSQSD